MKPQTFLYKSLEFAVALSTNLEALAPPQPRTAMANFLHFQVYSASSNLNCFIMEALATVFRRT